MNLAPAVRPASMGGPLRQPRAVGKVAVTSKLRGQATVLDHLHQSGSMKALFPRTTGDAMTAVLLNTGGGITGGDRLSVMVKAGDGTDLTLTTQAAERAYCAQPGETGRLETRLTVEKGARLAWLPQETILFDGARLQRRLRADIHGDGACLIIEPVVFGRLEMKERLHDLLFSDRIDVLRDGHLQLADRTRLAGDAEKTLRGSAMAGNCRAMFVAMLAAPDADRFLQPARELLPATGGASLLHRDLLVMRMLATDSYAMRQHLLPLVETLGFGPIPRTWMI